MTYANPCTVPGCRSLIHQNGLCRAHWWRLERFGDTFPDVPIGGLGPYRTTSVGVCKCTVSRPNPKCCTACGFPCVHRMAPATRDRALAKWPSLRAQTVLDPLPRRTPGAHLHLFKAADPVEVSA